MKKILTVVALLLCFALLFGACAKQPVEKETDAPKATEKPTDYPQY